MREKWHFAVIGAGNIGGIHALAIDHIPDARLVVCCDQNEDLARRLAEQYHADWTTDWPEAAAREDVDIVCVCTPSGAHMEVAVGAALQKKHVLVEKPMEVTLPRADAIIEACQKNGVKLGCIFPSRIRRGVIEAKKAIDAGRLGRLALCDAYVKWYRTQAYYDTSSWRGTWQLDGGGALMNQSIHSIDLLQYLAGPVKSLYARTGTLAHQIETEDTAVVLLEFAQGAYGVIEGSTSAWPGFRARIEISGDQGTIMLEDGKITGWKLKGSNELEEQNMLSLEEAEGSGASDPLGISYLGHMRQIQDMIEAVATGRAPQVDGLEGRKAVEIVCAIYRSQQLGQAVQLPLR